VAVAAGVAPLALVELVVAAMRDLLLALQTLAAAEAVPLDSVMGTLAAPASS
jgi:hypothetical protein